MPAVSYTLIRSDRKTVSITVKRDGSVVVRAPRRMSRETVDRFVRERSAWVERHLARIEAERAAHPPEPFSEDELQCMTEKMRAYLPPRIALLADRMGVSYGRITVRRQRTRWGSCSGRGNLNFNCLLSRLPPTVVDYVIVHELCHRLEMNHSARFWQTVERYCPDYREARAYLKEQGTPLMARLREGA